MAGTALIQSGSDGSRDNVDSPGYPADLREMTCDGCRVPYPAASTCPIFLIRQAALIVASMISSMKGATTAGVILMSTTSVPSAPSSTQSLTTSRSLAAWLWVRMP